MLDVKVTFEDHTQDLLAATRRGAEQAFARGALEVGRVAVESIAVSPRPGPPGGPVHTRRGKARRGIAYAANSTGAVVGFAASIMGSSQEKNERGLLVGRRKFPRRPTMQLAMQQAIGQIAGAWAGAITQ